MNRHLHPAGMAIAYFNMGIDDHRFADKSHGTHAYRISQFFQFHFQFGNTGISVAITDSAQTRGALAQYHAGVLASAKPDIDNRWLAGQAPLAKGDKAIEIKPLDPLNTIGGKQHTVIGTKQAAFMDGDQIYPFAIRFKTIFNLRRTNADIVVMIGAPQRVDPVRPQRYAIGGIGRGAAQSGFKGDWPASMRASLPILTYHRGVPVSPHMARRSCLATS